MPDLLELAERVSDGQAVDWAGAERESVSPDARRVVRNLRLVESLSVFHRREETGEGATKTLTLEAARPARPAATRGSAPASATFTPFAWGGLEVREKLGEGGFGEVYRAWDPKLQRDLALKLLKPESSGRSDFAAVVLHEARLLARVRHPNVVTVHGADAHDGRVGLWMELVRGRSLARFVEDQGRLGAREAAVLGVEVCRALAAVHGAGLVHRDVKAGNVMREEGGRILLMDFGAGIDAASVDEGNISGTPRYIAPEVYSGAKASARSDLYSLGVLLYHLVTGSYPMAAGTIGELRGRIERREARLLRDERPDLPEPFLKAVERALEWEPQDRFATAGEMEQALSAFLGADGAGSAGSKPAREAPGGISPGNATRVAASGARSVWGVLRLPLVVLAAAVLMFAVVRMFRPGGPVSIGPDGVPSSGPIDRSEGPNAGSAGSPLGRSGSAGSGQIVPLTPASAPYSVEASLWRVQRDGRRERLDPGARLSLGDRLALEFRTSAQAYLYVIDEDEQGHAYALFPLPDLEPQNPLPPGTTHLLPGIDQERKPTYWNVTSRGGREHLLILSSPERLVEFEAGMSRLKQAQRGATPIAIPDDVKVRLRGIGGLVQSSAPAGTPEKAASLFEMAEALAGKSELVRGVWLRRIDLDNPSR